MTMSTRDVLFLAGKALLACLVTMLIDDLVGNPDHVSSTFVAVLSVSAVALVGLREGVAQLVGSALGGVWGSLALAAGLHPLAAVPLAVGLAILTAFFARVPSGYPIAAFTALYLVLVPRGTPIDTFGIRLLAVSSGAVGGMIVNLAVSALFYRSIYARRLAAAETRVRALVPNAARGGPDAAENGFALLASLQIDLNHALAELKWRRARRTHAAIQKLWMRVEDLRSLLHLASNFGYVAQTENVPAADVEPFAAWLENPAGASPAVPEPLQVPARRVERALRRVDEAPSPKVLDE